ncbi:Transposase, Ptta/En/Spm, plant [Corchorus olitorius]|uniref:Transposase, Ptta/En/Spm, plant n=1 Tax=Corchorus olitorius TaxID=93759 RepID=A0A1R3IKA5_9ROSI|nr:Transposase, Ptta/En/Spm, plant [Corchorus olitorius]
MFQLTHTRKDGQPINEETRKVMIQLEHQSSTETVSSHRPSASNDVLARVMGRDPPGHVRMVKKEAEDQMEMMEKRVKAEMEAKMQESLQLITNSFYMALVQIKEKDLDIVIPDIFDSKEPSTSGVGIDDVGDDIYGDDIYDEI